MYLQLFFMISCIGTLAAQNTAETVVVNAAFEKVAPCPCDLTRGSCDVDCCCDDTCSDDEKRTFDRCIPFLAGGQDAETQQYKCASTHHQKEDWFPLLCVVFEYNAFLGYYYDWQYKLANNTNTFLSRLSTVSYYWYREQESRKLPDLVSGVYTYGSSVKTKPNNATNSLRIGVLVLPQLVLAGQCLNTAPVQYLRNLDHSCQHTMSADLCSRSSVLSQFYFIQRSGTSTPGSFFTVLQDGLGVAIAETTVTYKCANSNFLESYLKSTQTRSDVTDNTQVSTPVLDRSCIGSCGTDLCVDLYAPDADTTPAVPGDCPDQAPTAPSLNAAICQNAVIDVDYTIRWTGNNITRVEAVVILGNIPLMNAQNQANVLSQKIKVVYTHINTSLSNGSTDNFNNITDMPYERSGRVGYEKGKAIFSGSVVRNETVTPPVFQFVNTNSSRQMAVFQPTASDLCVDAGRRQIKFGEDITTACKLQLDMSNFTDCTSLRNYLFYYLNSLMPSDVLGRRGYNDILNTGYWVNVLREDRTELCSLAENFPRGLSPVDNRTGVCFNLTNGITLDIMYAETGQSNGFPIYEILGSRVSYKSATWQVQCSSVAGGACTGSGTSAFYLTSAVKFTQVPPQIPDPVPKYFEKPTEEDKELCPGGRCWDDLFFPFTNRYQSESKEYVFGMVSLVIIFFLGYGLVTRPWW